MKKKGNLRAINPGDGVRGGESQKVKLGEIFACREALQRLLAHDDIPVRYAIEIARFVRKVHGELILIEEQRNNLIRKYGTEENGRISVLPSSEGFLSFVMEEAELMAMESDLGLQRVRIPDNVNIPLGDLVVLEPFIDVVAIE